MTLLIENNFVAVLMALEYNLYNFKEMYHLSLHQLTSPVSDHIFNIKFIDKM